MSKKMKIVTIGGGSSYTPEIIEGFIQRYDEMPIREIWLVDVEAGREKLNVVGSLAKRMVEAAGIDCQVHLTLDRREALKDADFVTTQLRVGQLDARIKDERIPLSHGLIGQETNGAGGFAKALRTIPVILDICRDMEELCPDAWLINFTNPSGIVTEAVLKHSNIKCIGLCNLSQSMQRMVAEILNVDKSRFLLHLTGLNHFLYGTHVYMDGKDVMPEVLKNLKYDSAHKPKNIPDIPWLQEQIQHLGVIPCPYHQYYYATSDVLETQLQEFAEHGTRGEVVQKVEHELFELYKNPALHDKPKQLEQRGGAYYSEAACELISAIHNDKNLLMTVNVRNNGAIRSLPDNVAIETTCVIGRYGAIPLNNDPLPPTVCGLVSLMKAWEEMAVEAAVTGDYGAALQALTLNPLVPSGKVAKVVLDQLLEAHRAYLPQFFRE